MPKLPAYTIYVALRPRLAANGTGTLDTSRHMMHHWGPIWKDGSIGGVQWQLFARRAAHSNHRRVYRLRRQHVKRCHARCEETGARRPVRGKTDDSAQVVEIRAPYWSRPRLACLYRPCTSGLADWLIIGWARTFDVTHFRYLSNA